MTQEYKPVTREEPPGDMEYKSTTDTLIGYNPAQVPHSSRTGAAVTDDEREDAQIFPGTFAAGNGVQNNNVRRAGGGGARDGLATDSGGTQRSGRAGSSSSSRSARTGAGGKAGSGKTTPAGLTQGAKPGDSSGSSESDEKSGDQAKG